MKPIVVSLMASAIVCGLPLLAAGDEPPSAGVASVVGGGCGKPAAELAAGKTTNRAIASGGSNRSYLVHVPANYDAGKPWPVVLNFHGFGGNPV